MTVTAERSKSGSEADEAPQPQRSSHGFPTEWCIGDEDPPSGEPPDVRPAPRP